MIFKYSFLLLAFMFFIDNDSREKSDHYPDVIECESYVKILGETNINEFSLINHVPEVVRDVESNNGRFQPVKIPVDSFIASKPGIKEDLQEMLKSDEYPYIRVEIERRDLAECDQVRMVQKFETIITISGVSNSYIVPCTMDTCINEQYLLKGNLDLNLSDFDVEPPKVLFGIIKVHEVVNVDYAFLFEADDPIFR